MGPLLGTAKGRFVVDGASGRAQSEPDLDLGHARRRGRGEGRARRVKGRVA